MQFLRQIVQQIFSDVGFAILTHPKSASAQTPGTPRTGPVTVWDGAVPLMQLQGNRVSYQLEDHLASVRVEVDAHGQAVDWRDYTPYGAPLMPSAGDELSAGFAGLFWDPTAQVYHATARVYDPSIARFLQPDPQLRVPDASKDNHSLYAYAGGDPINFVDRNGADTEPFETVEVRR